MKGKISLTDFIKEVKAELLAAVDDAEPFFELGEVELEVSFALDISGKAGVKLYVAELGGETKGSQVHKVKIKLSPFVEDLPVDTSTGTHLSSDNPMLVMGNGQRTARQVSKPGTSSRRPPTASGKTASPSGTIKTRKPTLKAGKNV